jgi:carbamoyl-phosphate synthase large subunit
MPKKTVLVTGIGGNVGQGILRNIKDSFPEIHLIGVDISEFTPGNYLCDKTYKVPFSNNQNYIPRIQEVCNIEKVDLIIPSTDYEVYFLSKNQDSISASVISINLTYIMKKTAFHFLNLGCHLTIFQLKAI